ncbi:MAG: nucleotidyl transferase AbiEii/AbiGii toxin family protein [Bacteroidales bacterium]|nr:nucleotidyl transferase AbiEii/AbiGii toxin family protein [Bacteroidales bacterium]
MLFTNTVTANTLELLKNLQSENLLQDFNLVGGTALSFYFGHRKSIDLDLFTLNDFDTNELLEFLEQKYNFKTDYLSKNTVKGSIKEVKVDFLSHKYPLAGNVIKESGLRLLSIEDIAAMKLNAISGNGTRSKDFIDIYFILKQYSINDILKFYELKYSNRNLLHAFKSLVYFDDINNLDWPEMILEKDLKLKTVKKEITKNLKLYNKQI